MGRGCAPRLPEVGVVADLVGADSAVDPKALGPRPRIRVELLPDEIAKRHQVELRHVTAEEDDLVALRPRQRLRHAAGEQPLRLRDRKRRDERGLVAVGARSRPREEDLIAHPDRVRLRPRVLHAALDVLERHELRRHGPCGRLVRVERAVLGEVGELSSQRELLPRNAQLRVVGGDIDEVGVCDARRRPRRRPPGVRTLQLELRRERIALPVCASAPRVPEIGLRGVYEGLVGVDLARLERSEKRVAHRACLVPMPHAIRRNPTSHKIGEDLGSQRAILGLRHQAVGAQAL
mmetsp:Transcript_43089/g.140409  ORF Transcript_43089/g.140409 Transcript_43089/m.140409 type:complete len:292 (+) Transcript_43089:706-1581(+)